MRDVIGTFQDSISTLTLSKRMLNLNTLILGEEGSGKTNLACKIRNFVIDSGISTLYIDFANSDEVDVEARYKDEAFNYIRYEESDAFDAKLDALIAENKHIYLAADPKYFSSKRDEKSRLSRTLQKQALLDNYYFFFHDIKNLDGFYTKFDDFLLYILSFSNLSKYGLTFLAQPHETFERAKLKLIFTFLFIGHASNAKYFNTANLKGLPKNEFLYQYRTKHKTLLFNDIRTHHVKVDEYEGS